MGASLRPDTAKARVSRNVDKMLAQGASDAEVEEYIHSEGIHPVGGSSLHSVAPPPQQHPAVDDDIDNERGGILAPIQHAAEGLVSGLPFASRAVSGYRGLASLVTGHSLDEAAHEVDASQRSQRVHVDKLPAVARLPLQILGGAPAAALAAPLGLVGGGAAVGAAMGLDKPAKSIGERIRNTGTNAALGAVTAKAGQQLGRGVKNVADRTGLTDVLAKGVEKLSPAFASTMGSRGQVNTALGARQEILDQLGDTGESAGETLLGKVATRKGTANALYTKAKADTRALDDPELQALLSDPQVKQVFERVSAIRNASGTPLPRDAAPAQVPLALQKMGVSPERYAELQALGQSRRVPISGVDVLPPELLGDQPNGIELPDPQALHQVKRALDKIIHGRMGSELPLSQDEALALAPKFQAIRTKLHDLSPAWQEADAYYAHAMGEEQGFKKGVDALRVSKNPRADKLTQDSPAALQDWLSKPRHAAEPEAAMADRIQAFQQGGRQSIAGDLRNQPVTKDLGAILKANGLAPTETGQQVRSMLFEDSDAAQQFEQLLASKRGAVSDHALPGRMGRLLKTLTSAPDRVATPTGQSLLADRLRDAGLLKRELANHAEGAPIGDFLSTLLGITGAGQVTR